MPTYEIVGCLNEIVLFYCVKSNKAPGPHSSFYKSHTSNNLVTDENPPLSPPAQVQGRRDRGRGREHQIMVESGITTS